MVAFFGNCLILSTICVTVCDSIGLPVNGEYGIPALANNKTHIIIDFSNSSNCGSRIF